MFKIKCKFIISFFVLFNLLNTANFSVEAITLKKIYYYPQKDDDYYFRSLVDLIIFNNNIYAVENFKNNIVVFRFEKDNIVFSSFIGKPGQGPGDLQYPNRISIWKDELAVKDALGFSFYFLNGKFINKFKTFSAMPIFVLIENKIYWLNIDPKDDHLIEIYSKDGRFINNLGKKFHKIDLSLFKEFNPFYIEQIIYDGNLLTDGSFLYYLNSGFGDVIKYNLNGEQILKKNLANVFGKRGTAVLDKNRKIYFHDGLKISKDGSREYPRNYIFKDAYISGRFVYLLSGDYTPGENSPNKEISIKVLSLDTLELSKEYRILKNDVASDWVICFSILEIERTIFFIVCMHTENGYYLNLYKE